MGSGGCAEAETSPGHQDHLVIIIMDRDSLTLQINNMRFQAKMERWPLSKSIEAMKETEPNVYLPLDTFRQHQVGSVEEALVPQTVPDQLPSDSNPGGAPGGGNGEEPPPSYDSLFPINDAADDLNRGQSLVNE